MIRSTVGFDRSLTIDRELYTEKSKRVNQVIHESKMKFYANVNDENTNNQRVLFSCFGKILNTSAAKRLPTHDCPRNLANIIFLRIILTVRSSVFVRIFQVLPLIP